MTYNILAIFSDTQLKEIEEISLCTLMPQGAKNQMIKACEDYRYLVSSLQYTKGLSEQVILFLLDSESCTMLGADKFLEKLVLWVMVVEDENEQRMYADILRYSYYLPDELLSLRFALIDILQEIERNKKTKNSQDILVKNKIPMQLDPDFDTYATWMMNYGSEFDSLDSSFSIVPNLKGKFNSEQTPFYDAFSVSVENWEPPI